MNLLISTKSASVLRIFSIAVTNFVTLFQALIRCAMPFRKQPAHRVTHFSGNPDDPIDYRKINKRVEKRMKRRKDFQDAIVAFFVVTAMSWTMYFIMNGFNFNTPAWPLILMVIMAVIVVWQGIETYFLADARERERNGCCRKRSDGNGCGYMAMRPLKSPSESELPIYPMTAN